ncbi:Formamidopyrimidine-DNA glycosylase, catalytic domain [Dillenia turbinata]|uniref:Formamidopyrimidine-DNA glycosylase, catalytic domain n=1 Tax=Dillenia turbinata TaxID=194707 RepID=A0AAN8YZC5_9MAGN
MPELPEVEAARRAIEEHCIGKTIKRCVVADDSTVIEGVTPSEVESSLLNRIIVSAKRKGKNMWLVLDSPPFPSFQFGMAGAIYIKGVAVTKYKRSAVKDTDEWPSKYSKLFIELDDGLELSFTDKRRFARVRLLADPTLVPPISELGPDALLEPLTGDELFNSFSKKKIAIKALLLDQSFIAGIGNWVADEVLYQARIHPLQSAASLSRESCATLHKCIKEVLEKALEVGADSSQYPSNWIFHSREKKPGKAFVDGKKLDFIKAGGRTTAYVPDLQRLPVTQATKAKSKKQASRKNGAADDDELESEEEEAAVKTKKVARSTAGRSKEPSKRKSKQSEDEEEEEEGENDGDEENDEDDNADDGKDAVNQKKTPKISKVQQSKVKAPRKAMEMSKRGIGDDAVNGLFRIAKADILLGFFSAQEQKAKDINSAQAAPEQLEKMEI